MSTQPRSLSARQRFWLEHIQACGNGSLRAYAAANELSANALYRARTRLRELGVITSARRPRIVRVRRDAGVTVPPATNARCRIMLPNGAVIEVACDAAAWSTVLAGVAALP